MSELPNSLLFAIIAVLTVLSAFFSSSETAMIGLNRYRLRHLVKEKHRGARKANSLLRRPDRLLGVILIGNNLANFMAASVATIIGLRLFGDSGVVITPVILTIYFLIFAEVAPKTLAAQVPERIAFPAAHLLTPLLSLMYPLVFSINAVANLLVKPFIPRTEESNDDLSVDELRRGCRTTQPRSEHAHQHSGSREGVCERHHGAAQRNHRHQHRRRSR
jgi:Mg2+/Co2+ transporter CorB